MTPSGLDVTFMAPVLTRAVVERPRLFDRLGPDAASRWSLVTGPAGAGKTTLVRSWLATINRPWVWMSIDSALVAPGPFWAALTHAVQRALPGVTLNAVDEIGVDSPGTLQIANQLVSDLLQLDPDVAPVIVLDDVHLLDLETWETLEWLLPRQPPTVHLVLASRSQPPFSVARARALGWVSEIRQHELVLSNTEVREVALRAGVTNEHVWAGLRDATEGWAAGIRLGLLSISEGNEPTQVATAFRSHVSELLVTEALERHRSRTDCLSKRARCST